MASERSLQKQSKSTFVNLVEKDWGLRQCLPEHNCKFCELYEPTDGIPRLFRNLYVAGIPADVIPKILDIDDGLTTKEIERHAYNQTWQGRRKKLHGLQITTDLVGMMALRRWADTKHVASGNSADKALEVISKIAGVGREININGHIGFSWEQAVTKARQAGQDALITIDDDEDTLVDLPEEDFETVDA